MSEASCCTHVYMLRRRMFASECHMRICVVWHTFFFRSATSNVAPQTGRATTNAPGGPNDRFSGVFELSGARKPAGSPQTPMWSPPGENHGDSPREDDFRTFSKLIALYRIKYNCFYCSSSTNRLFIRSG